MNVKAIEAAGLYVESSQGGIAKEDLKMVCDGCGKELMDVPKGSATFTQTHGRCSCSWRCCEKATPGNRPHERHLTYRRVR